MKFMRLNNKHKQKGLTATETTIAMLIGSVVLLGALKAGPNLMFSLDKQELLNETSAISEAVMSWKGTKPNLDGISITELCSSSRESLDEGVCGTSADGSESNPFGGDYDISVSSNKSQWDLTITSIEESRIDEVAEMLAPLTSDRCTEVTGCSTISVGSDSVTLTM
jgi:hypothetical protein